MERIEADMWVRDTVAPDTAPVLSEDQINAALNAARVVDANGFGPMADSYTETIDEWYALGVLLEAKAFAVVLGNTGSVSSFTSEGSSFTVKGGTSAAEFNQLAAEAFARSRTVGRTISTINLEPTGEYTRAPRSWPPNGLVN
jgi:hypothetical protein